MANENKKIAMAVRANDEIIMCTWIHSDTGDEYRLASTIKHNILYGNHTNIRKITSFTKYILFAEMVRREMELKSK